MSNPSYDRILTTTFANHRAKLVDNIYKARPLTFYLKKAGNIEMRDGGTEIVEDLVYATNSTFSSFTGADTITLQAYTAEEFTAANYAWKQAAINVAITKLDELKNAGSSRIINLLASKLQNAEESAVAGFNTMFYADGTGNTSKDFNGLKNLVDNTGTVGGINGATSTYWQSFKDATVEALTIAKMNTAFTTASHGSDIPNLLITTQGLFEKYESLLAGNMRYTDSEVGDGGFMTLEYKGLPLTFDRDCEATRMYFVNTKYLKLVGHKDEWGRMTDWFTPQNQNTRTAMLYFAGNLIVSSRRHHAVLAGKS